MTSPRAFWRPQHRRQLAVATLYLGYLAGLFFCGITLRGSLPHGVGIVLMIISGLAVVFGLIGVIQSHQTFFVGSVDRLDERQRSVRDRAYYSAYRALSLLGLAGVLYLVLVQLRRLPPAQVGPGMAMLLAGGAALLLLTLPSAIMAWTEPDPPEDSGGYGMINRRPL